MADGGARAASRQAPRIGFLGAGLNAPQTIENYQAFLIRLRELGFVDGQTVVIERGLIDDPRGTFVAAELMRSQPDLIVASGTEASLQAVVGVRW